MTAVAFGAGLTGGAKHENPRKGCDVRRSPSDVYETVHNFPTSFASSIGSAGFSR